MNSYRSVLEVIHYLSYKDVLHSSNSVSQTWKKASDSQELWTSFTEAIGLEVQSVSKAKFKSILQASFLLNLEGQLCIYRCLSRTVNSTLIRKLLFVSDTTSALFLSGNELLFCGGLSKHTYIYHVNSTTVTELGMMLKRRQYPGLISDAENVYAFGGKWSGPFESCEKLSLSTEQWSALPDMLVPRSQVKPCSLGTTVYLCGGCRPEELQCEKFDTVSSQFSSMEMQFPVLSSVKFAYVWEDELVIVGNKAVHVYQADTLDLVSRTPHEIDNWFFILDMNPVTLGRMVYFSRNWDSIYQLDVTQGKLGQIYPSERQIG